MLRSFLKFLRDDAGFVLSGELVLVATVGVLSLVVGLSNVAASVSSDLDEAAYAFGRLTQTCHAQTPCTPAKSDCRSQNGNSNPETGAADFGSTQEG